ncbi:MAG: hypothetical protein Q7T74_03080 [Candidatus Saccharibacteria bacterium]|nr:hypothetical protein [Candidatus Saccharibacteria bacterium]
MIQGKPVFDAPSGTRQSLDTEQTSSSMTAPPVNESVPAAPAKEEAKVIPTFMLQHCESHINGGDMDVTVWATNTSDVDIEIDKCVILDTKTEIDRRLSPGQAHEIILYRGAIPKTDHAHKANIFYKSIKANDYYRVDFSVEYNHESDEAYTVEDLHPEHYAIKDLSRSGLL